MKNKEKFNRMTAFACALIMLAAIMSVHVLNVRAGYTTWDSLEGLDMTKDTGEGQYSLKSDIGKYGENYTNDVGKIYADVSHYFDDIRMDADSRLTYARKIMVDAGQEITIVAAKEDTEDNGGASEDAGLSFYWSMCEYDELGNIVFDGGWRSSSGTWTVGYTDNSGTGYGLDGYPAGEDDSSREKKVKYVVPIFRWNNYDESVGSGSDLKIYAENISGRFPILYIVTEPFTYTFDLNGGTLNGSTNSYTMQRLGISDVESYKIPGTPSREGYTFAGWKITSTGGKQTGKTYTASQLTGMLTDGKYWSSLFENATFQAQWIRTDVSSPDIEMNGTDWINTDFTLQASAYDTVSGLMGISIKDSSKTEAADNLNAQYTACPGLWVKDGVDYSYVFNPVYYAQHNADLLNAYGYDTEALFNHFLTSGMAEGRQAGVNFDVNIYKIQNPDLTTEVLSANGYSSGNAGYYEHYCKSGASEGRTACSISGMNEAVKVSKEMTNLSCTWFKDGTDYSAVFNPVYYAQKNPDIVNALGCDAQALFNHFINYGMKEGRAASVNFDINVYKACYGINGSIQGDLGDAYGDDSVSYYLHYINSGMAEGRTASDIQNLTYTVTDEGVHEFTATAMDNAGNMAEVSAEVKIDKSAPLISGVSESYGYKFGQTVTVNASAKDALSGVSTFKLYRKGAGENGSSKLILESTDISDSGSTASLSYTFSGDGEYYLEAVDKVGNTSQFSFSIEESTDDEFPPYKVSYDADGGTLIDTSGKEAEKTTVEYDYGIVYDFYTAERAYTVAYNGNGGEVLYSDDSSANTTAKAVFNGWNESLDVSTDHGSIDGSTSYTTGSWNWAAYLNGNADLMGSAGTKGVYDTVFAIRHYRGYGKDEGRQFSGSTYWLPAVRFKNLTANGGTVYVKADYTNGSVTLAGAEKEAAVSGGVRTEYTFTGWYTDSACTQKAGDAGSTYTPSGNITLYAGFSEKNTNLTAVQKIYVRYENTDGSYTDYSERMNKAVPIGSEVSEDWSGLDDTKWIKPNAISYIVTGDKESYVDIKRQKYTVTYDYRTNGGTYAEKETMQVYYGADADLSVKAVKEGWEHTGWNTDSSAHAGFAKITVTGTVTVYATYRKDITVTFVDFEDTVSKKLTIYNTQEYAETSVPDINVYSGYDRVSDIKAEGYSSSQDINSENAEKCELQPGDTLKVKESAAYYAVCSATAALSYVLNGGSANDTTKDVCYTVYCNAAAPQEVKGMQLLLGESEKESFDEEGYTHTFVFAVWAENSEDSDKKYACNEQYILKENTVMYALWNETVTPITYFIAFDGNAGQAVKNIPESITAVYDTPVTVPEDKPDRTGLEFLSWNTSPDGSGTEFAPGDTALNLTVINGGTVTLYAQWKKRGFVMIKSAKTGWADFIIKRTMGDDDWYDTAGYMTIRELEAYPDELCEAVWHIDKEGNISQVK